MKKETLRLLVAELKKLAMTFEEYKKLHPKTKKKPTDPMFSKKNPNPPKKPKTQHDDMDWTHEVDWDGPYY